MAITIKIILKPTTSLTTIVLIKKNIKKQTLTITNKKIKNI